MGGMGKQQRVDQDSQAVLTAGFAPMSRRRKLVFVINSIGEGGAERALDTVLRAVGDHAARYEMHLVLLDDEPERRILPALDGRHCLDARGSLLKSISRLRSCLDALQPDLVVSLLVRSNLANAVAGIGRPWRTILCERMHLSSHLAGRYTGAALRTLRLLPRLLYPRADLILAVSEGVQQDLIDTFGLAPSRTRTIHNPYDLDAITRAGAEQPVIALPERYMVAVGRLVEAKGFHDLIEAYRRADPAPSLVILGDGDQRQALEAQISTAGLTGRVLLPGFVEQPFAIMARARCLVSASRNEGFPNAIAEAMVLGRPVLATDCPSGPAELLGGVAVRPGEVVEAKYGLLVCNRDVDGLAKGLARIDDDALCARLGQAARGRMDDFRVAVIAARYWDTFDGVLAATR